MDQRHDVRKCDEIMNSRRNELSVFIRITFSTYSSSAVPMHEMMAILGQKEIRSCLNTYGTMTAWWFLFDCLKKDSLKIFVIAAVVSTELRRTSDWMI